MRVFTDESATYDLRLTSTNWSVSSGGLPNGDNYSSPSDLGGAPTFHPNVGSVFNLMDGTAWTIELWFWYGADSAVQCNIVGLYPVGGDYLTNAAWWVAITSTEDLTFVIMNTASGAYLQTGANAVAASTWHHVVFVKETGNVIKTYHQGVLVNTDSSTSGTARSPSATWGLYLGASADFGDPMLLHQRAAKLAIYNRELTLAEVEEHYEMMTT